MNDPAGFSVLGDFRNLYYSDYSIYLIFGERGDVFLSKRATTNSSGAVSNVPCLKQLIKQIKKLLGLDLKQYCVPWTTFFDQCCSFEEDTRR